MTTGLRYPGKVVIVTGGTKGIGLAIVREFVRQGANVVFCSRASGAKRGQAIQRELQASGCPGDAYYQVCDVRKESEIKRLILVTVERFGCLDCLVNNAGQACNKTIDDMSAQDFRNILEVNTVSYFLASKYALPYLRETKGNIINMASISGVRGVKKNVSYASSKGTVIAMTKALAIDESKYGVRVNSLSPSSIWTPLIETLINHSTNPEATMMSFKDKQPSRLGTGESSSISSCLGIKITGSDSPSSIKEAHLVMGRMGAPEEVARAALFLAADGTFCTGLNLLISGGAELDFGKKSQVDLESSAGGNSQGFSHKQ